MTRNTPVVAQTYLDRVKHGRLNFKAEYQEALDLAKERVEAEFRERKRDLEHDLIQAKQYGASVRECGIAWGTTDRKTIYDILKTAQEIRGLKTAALDGTYSWGEFTTPDVELLDPVSNQPYVVPGESGYGLRAVYADWGSRHLTVTGYYYAAQDKDSLDWTFRAAAQFGVDDSAVLENKLDPKRNEYYLEANAWARESAKRFKPPTADAPDEPESSEWGFSA